MSKGKRKTRRLKLSSNFSSRNRDLVSLATYFIVLPKFKETLVHVLPCPLHCCCLGLTPRQGLGTTIALGGDSGWDTELLWPLILCCSTCPVTVALLAEGCEVAGQEEMADYNFNRFYCSTLCKRAAQFFIFKLGGLVSVFPIIVKELKSTGPSFFFKSFV